MRLRDRLEYAVLPSNITLSMCSSTLLKLEEKLHSIKHGSVGFASNSAFSSTDLKRRMLRKKIGSIRRVMAYNILLEGGAIEDIECLLHVAYSTAKNYTKRKSLPKHDDIQVLIDVVNGGES